MVTASASALSPGPNDGVVLIALVRVRDVLLLGGVEVELRHNLSSTPGEGSSRSGGWVASAVVFIATVPQGVRPSKRKLLDRVKSVLAS